MKKILKIFLWAVLILAAVFIFFIFVVKPPQAEGITWGVSFSQKHAELLGLNWQKTYLAMLDELKVKNLRVISDWDLREPEGNNYQFGDLDWQIQKAGDYDAKIILVIGVKTPHWPECHIPDWAKNQSIEKQQAEVLELLKKTVLRYKNSKVIWAWQIENEPFFQFGVCPPEDKEFFKKEIDLVSSIDERPIIVTDSGEMALWFNSAKLGDIVGVTMYKRVWYDFSDFWIKISGGKLTGAYIHYPFPPMFYWAKAKIVEKLFNKKVIVVELQAESWTKLFLYYSSLEEQNKTMDLNKFREIISFARKTGFDEFYLWGGEWWYWLKEKHNDSGMWDEAKKLW